MTAMSAERPPPTDKSIAGVALRMPGLDDLISRRSSAWVKLALDAARLCAGPMKACGPVRRARALVECVECYQHSEQTGDFSSYINHTFNEEASFLRLWTDKCVGMLRRCELNCHRIREWH